MRRIYPVHLVINQQKVSQVVIDPHYEEKHANHMDDELILKLVSLLNGKRFRPEGEADSGFRYYKADPLIFDGKVFRLIWCQHPEESYIGVINAFRRKYGKKRPQ